MSKRDAAQGCKDGSGPRVRQRDATRTKEDGKAHDTPQMQKQRVTQRPLTIKTLHEVGTEGVTPTGGRPRAQVQS